MTSTSYLKRKRNNVEKPMEKKEIWAFTNTKCRVYKKISFKWNTLFQSFQSKYFQVLFQDDPSKYLSIGIYKSISKYGLHWAIAKTPFLPYLDVIEWTT